MKIIFFNINDGTIDPTGVEQFIQEHLHDTDVFCFQEVFENCLDKFEKLFIDYSSAYSYKWVTEPDFFGQATYIKPQHTLQKVRILHEKNPSIALGLLTKITVQKQEITLVNYHGMSRPVDKLDSEGRLEQSREIVDTMNRSTGLKIVGGDFNLFPETESIKILEENGLTNLIKIYNITNTRNEVVWRKFPNNKQYFSDYVFVNCPQLVKSYAVPYNEYSDHLPQILELNI